MSNFSMALQKVEGGFLFWFDVCIPTEKVGQQNVKQVSANCTIRVR